MSDFGLIMPFWIDTDGYSDRDREMFVCGVEFQTVYSLVQSRETGDEIDRPVHVENEDRLRMMLNKLGVAYVLTPTEPPTEGWLRLRCPPLI